MYISTVDSALPGGDQEVAEDMRDNLEDALMKYDVDLAVRTQTDTQIIVLYYLIGLLLYFYNAAVGSLSLVRAHLPGVPEDLPWHQPRSWRAGARRHWHGWHGCFA